MNGINNYFDRIQLKETPEDFAGRVMSAKQNASVKRRGFKPLAAVAAAAAVLALGATGAAAAGLLDFNSIFGGFMMSEDEKLAEELLSCAENVEWSVSDDSYEIVVKGVAGSQYDMLVNYEIVRTDGKPAKDFFINLPKDGKLTSVATDFSDSERYLSEKEAGADMKQSSSTAITINEDGNIEIFCRLISDTDITGTRQSAEGYNLYPQDEFTSFKYNNDILDYIDDNGAVFAVGVENNNFILSDISPTDERIIGLPLEWSISFDYYPTEAALKSKSISDMSQPVTLLQRSGMQGLKRAEYTIYGSSFSSVGGRLMIQQPDADPSYHETPAIANDYMESCLITSDGKQTEVALECISRYYEGYEKGLNMFCVDVRYSTDESSEIAVINVDDIAAISINGTVYPIG